MAASMPASAFPEPGGGLPLGEPQESPTGALVPRTGHPTELPDLLTRLLDSIQSSETRRHYGRAVLEFAQYAWSKGREKLAADTLSSWRNHLKELGLSASTVNQKLAAVKKLARQAAAAGLLSDGQAAGICSTGNVRQLGTRSGMWLTQAQAQALIEAPEPSTLKGKRDRAALALLLGCGLRRDEAARLNFEDIQQRDGRWVIPDLRGKHGRIRTVPVPAWVKAAVDRWQAAAEIASGRILRAINKGDRIAHDSLTGNALLDLAARYGSTIGVDIRPHDLRRTCAKLCRKHGGELEQIQLLLGHASIQTTERYLGTQQNLEDAPNDHLGLKWRHE